MHSRCWGDRKVPLRCLPALRLWRRSAAVRTSASGAGWVAEHGDRRGAATG